MYIVIAVLALFVIGFTSFVMKKNRLDRKVLFLHEFIEKFREYCNSGGNNNEAYGWLIHRSNKMQNQLGSQGIVSSFKPPYANYCINNYAIILNMLPALNESLRESLLHGQAEQYARAIDEALIRHWGSLSDREEFLGSRLRNPIYWFQQGIRQVTGVPFYILSLFGILSVGTANSIVGSALFGVLSGLVTLVGFASAVLNLVVGWEDFLAKVQQFS
ncbi:hypothetical protein Q5N47_18025 [Vibrio cholerae]|uniref:hypothetical protein n=4 Tax=Vibrio cholerae TaxID=666 RepID=UPI002934685C|nr:hypothetical protein [Vibrio cholerae]MDV2373084.1 hypothetical protein [Vibrio cholerae]